MWKELAIRSVHPGAWVAGIAADGKHVVAFRSLTTGLEDAPGQIYLAAIRMDYVYKANFEPHQISEDEFLKAVVNRSWNLFAEDPLCKQYIDVLTQPTSESTRLKPGRYKFNLLRYPTELPGLNKAFTELDDEYAPWVISTSLSKYDNSYIGCGGKGRLKG